MALRPVNSQNWGQQSASRAVGVLAIILALEDHYCSGDGCAEFGVDGLIANGLYCENNSRASGGEL